MDVEVEVQPYKFPRQDYDIAPSSDRLQQPNIKYQQRRYILAFNLPGGQKPGHNNLYPTFKSLYVFVHYFRLMNLYIFLLLILMHMLRI